MTPSQLDPEQLIQIANDIISKQLIQPDGAPHEVLMDFWCSWVYWELKLYTGVQTGIDVIWKEIQKHAGVVDHAVLDLYSEFRVRANLNADGWKKLVELMASSLSLADHSNASLQPELVESAAGKDIYSRTLTADRLATLLRANAWVVPMLLFKMGPAPVSNTSKRR